MSLEIRPFYKLLNMKFVIPPYQRGYRWDRQQVIDLLRDLKVFRKEAKKANDYTLFYCLQPITVVPVVGEKDAYTVVDGQQRLTTVYMLLHFFSKYLNDSKFKPYDLSLPQRDLQGAYLRDLKFMEDDTVNVADKDADKNIDLFYLRKAYQTIEQWYESQENKRHIGDIMNFFTPHDEDDNELEVRVIWHQLDGRDPLITFRNLNYGKIPLTSTELVKALLLQGEASNQQTAARRAMEWDDMEHTLQRGDLWSIFADSKDATPAHIEIILDFIADELNESLDEDKQYHRKRPDSLDEGEVDRFNYYVVDEYLRSKKDIEKNIEEDIWPKIRTIYNHIKDWYDNRQWYHLIGLLRLLQDKKDFNRRKFLRHVYDMSFEKGCAVNRSQFTDTLKKEIGDKIGQLSLANLRYGRDDKAMIRVLTAVNVKCAMDDSTEGTRFDFKLFDHYNVTSLEHIHPQNIQTDMKFAEFQKWIKERGNDLRKLTVNDLAASINDNSTNQDKAQAIYDGAIEALGHLERDVDEAYYNDKSKEPQIQDWLKTFDKVFGEMAGISQDELHSLKNIALVDRNTNSALQNHFLDQKRQTLMERHNKPFGDKDATYAPPSTRLVFSKGYNPQHPGDMRFWTKKDRDIYFEKIRAAYDYFPKTQQK